MAKDQYFLCPIDDLVPDPGQPRQIFDPVDLDALAKSIRERGVIMPIVVRKKEGKLEIVAGERRWRASKQAGLNHVPVVVKELDDRTAYEIAVIENTQRADLNPIEEAVALKRLCEEHNLPVGVVAQLIGKSAPYVSNSIRLLSLEKEHQDLLVKKAITARDARILLTVESPEDRAELLKLILDGIGTRDAEAWARRSRESESGKHRKNRLRGEHPYKDLIDLVTSKVRVSLGEDVEVALDSGRSGRVEISFDSLQNLYRILAKLTGGQK